MIVVCVEDLAEVWRELRIHADVIQLWCDGLKVEASSRKKRKKSNLTDDEDSEDDRPKRICAERERG